MGRFVSNNGITAIRLNKASVYSAPGANSWIVPTGVTCATFEVWGAGGGGGAKCCCDCYRQGQSGSPGGYTSMTIPVTPGDSYTLCIGAGGGTSYIGGFDTYCHACCAGGFGGVSYVTGNNIVTLCAAGGGGGCNMCYLYCMCAAAYSCATVTAAAYSNATVNTSLVAANAYGVVHAPNMASSVTPFAEGWIGIGSDSQAYYYQSGSTGYAFQHAMLAPIHCPCQYNNADMACSNKSTFGGGGRGYFSTTCCCCGLAGVGRHGAIIIRY